MKYKYLYQTKDNENREGWVKARNREDAFHKLRVQGIKPYRLIGDDPVNWIPWMVGGVVAILLVALGAALMMPKGADDRSPRLRQQIVGDGELIASNVANDWEGTLTTRLDKYLAAYAQPGGNAVPPYVEPEEMEGMTADLDVALEYPDGESSECRQLKNIVAFLREEMLGELAAGKTVQEYFDFLEERQREEIALRQHAEASVMKAPESYRERMAAGVNAQLKARGIAPVRIAK